MRVTSFRVTNIRSFDDSGDLTLGPVTLLVGKNNSGKSTLLRSLYSMQAGMSLAYKDVRFGTASASISIQLGDVNSSRHWQQSFSDDTGELLIEIPGNAGNPLVHTLATGTGHRQSVNPIQPVAPNAFISPYLARRRVTGYSEAINRGTAMAVGTDLSNLVARVDLLMDRHHPRHEDFMELLSEVVGLPLSAIPSDSGKRIGMWVSNSEAIYLEDMGDGVAQLLGFIASLCLADEQLFLIEEIENDIHPEALKLLLGVIERRRHQNQFVVSTHNNVVLRSLGSLEGTVIHEITLNMAEEGVYRLPTSEVHRVGSSPAERIKLLKHLGYELSDMDLWDGWLLLEESSAERIIRDHLVRWFAPQLSRVKTVAAAGTGDLEPSFTALYKLVLFTHLESRYKGRVVVFADGDPSGSEAVAKLKKKFSEWPSESFHTFTEPDFERYYPSTFSEKTDAALALLGKQKKRAAKEELLLDVLAWIEEDDERARAAFELSAAEVIEKLRRFEIALGPVHEIQRDGK